MIYKMVTTLILTMFLGGNAMASESLTAKEKAIASAAAYTALGNQEGLKKAVSEGLDAGVTVNEFKEISSEKSIFWRQL